MIILECIKNQIGKIMNRILISICLIVFLQLPAFSQNEDSLKALPYPIRKAMSPNISGKYFSTNDEMAILLERVLDDIDLYDIPVGIPIDTVTSGPKLQRLQYTLPDLAGADEAVIVTSATIMQDTLKTDESDGLIDSFRKKENYYTETVLTVDFFDIEEKTILGSMELFADNIDKNREKSRKGALRNLAQKATFELKQIYWYSAGLTIKDKNTISAPLGTERGAYKGLTFQIMEPERIWQEEDGEYVEPGGPAGFATVVETDKDSSTLVIHRQWRPFYSDAWIVEHPYPLYALKLNITPPTFNGYFNLGIGVHGRPMNYFDWGFDLHYTQTEDSFNENNYGFGFGGFAMVRYFNTPTIDLGFIGGLDIDIPFRKDDNDNVVSTFLLSTYLGLTFEIPVTSHMDFIATSGYRFGIEADEWEYSVDDESLPAFWENEKKPSVKNSGLLFSVGFKFILF